MKTIVLKTDPYKPDREVIRSAAEVVKRGELLAFPTETVYGLAADAMNPQAVARVFEVKGRPSGNPLPVQVASADDIIPLVAEISEAAKKLMSRFWPGPVTIVFRSTQAVSGLITAGTGKIGIRVPDHAVALGIIREVGRPIVAPSANPSGKEPPTSAEEVLAYFEGKIAMVVDAGPCALKTASTVVDAVESPVRIIRAGAVSEDMIRACLDS